MELHSYAKRRVTLKKWTIEQKRKLVETRIAYEKLFAQKPRGSVIPWKKVLSLTSLDDYNVYFVRKQWANMVAKYKQYKENRLGNIPTQAIDKDMILKISQEWEFFEPIHDYMMCKSRNLHSYALQHDQEPNVEGNSNSNSTLSSNECNNIYSSDETNYVSEPLECIIQNTDHDFYSKKLEENQNHFADANVNNTQEPSIIMEIETEFENKTQPQQQLGLVNEVIVNCTQENTVPTDVQQLKLEVESQAINKIPNMLEADVSSKLPTSKKQHMMNERDRYYRHKRRFNRRCERRFDAILQVMGQVVKAEYPTIDVSPLIREAKAVKDYGINLNAQIFSSGDDFDEESTEDIARNLENDSHWHQKIPR